MRIEYPRPGQMTLQPGTQVYGLAFRYDRDKDHISLRARPTLGQLRATTHGEDTERAIVARGWAQVNYFVPLTRSGKLALSRAVRVESRCYCDDLADAETWYDEQVLAAAKWLRDKADEVERDLINPTTSKGVATRPCSPET